MLNGECNVIQMHPSLRHTLYKILEDKKLFPQRAFIVYTYHHAIFMMNEMFSRTKKDMTQNHFNMDARVKDAT